MHIYLSASVVSLLSGLLGPLMTGHAYLDPGSGSFILQLIIASALGAIFLLRGYITRGIASVRRKFNRSDSTEEDDDQE